MARLSRWRPDFDEWLLAEAQAAGVSVRRPCAVLGVTVEDGAVRGVVTAEGAVRAPSVVDASGRARWLGRQLSIPSPACSPTFIARFGYVGGPAGRATRPPC
jgi:flavin-dependent dehydrogenase